MNCGQLVRTRGSEIVISAATNSVFTLLISCYSSSSPYFILVGYGVSGYTYARSLGGNGAGVKIYKTDDADSKLVITSQTSGNYNVSVNMLGNPMGRAINVEVVERGTTTNITEVEVTSL